MLAHNSPLKLLFLLPTLFLLVKKQNQRGKHLSKISQQAGGTAGMILRSDARTCSLHCNVLPQAPAPDLLLQGYLHLYKQALK